MGAWQSMEERMLRSQQQQPLMGRSAASLGVVGTFALDADYNASYIFGSGYISSPLCCSSYRGDFRVPWPCHCCGADCVCCPHSPRGAAFDAAMAGGFAMLLAEAGQLAMGAIGGVAAGGVTADGQRVPPHVLLGSARAALFAERWTPRANALLRNYGLRAAVFNWIHVRHDDKGNRTGEAARCAVQIYDAAAFDGAGGLGVVVAGLTGAVQQPMYAQQPFYGGVAPMAPGFAPMVPVAVPVAARVA